MDQVPLYARPAENQGETETCRRPKPTAEGSTVSASFNVVTCMANRPEHILCVRACLQPIPFGTPCRHPYRAIEHKRFLTSMRKSSRGDRADSCRCSGPRRDRLVCFLKYHTERCGFVKENFLLLLMWGVIRNLGSNLRLVGRTASWMGETFPPAIAVRRTGLKKGSPPDPLPKTFHSRPGGRGGLL